MDFSKQKVDVAVVNRSKLDVSSTHITTASFMQLNPVYYRHMIPGEHLRGNCNALTRLAPVAVPTYGRCRLNLRSFFVPFRTIFPNFNEFITDTIASNVSTNSLVGGSPYVTNWDFLNYFIAALDPNGNALCSVESDPNKPVDFVGTDGNRYVLSYFGRRALKILHSLGYRVVWDVKTGHTNDMSYSALALLAYAKVYVDWYSNAAYADSLGFLTIQRWFKYNDPSSSFHFDNTCLQALFNFVYNVCYDTGNDVFVNAWDNPIAPNSSNYSTNLGGTDITGGAANSAFSVALDSNGTPYMVQSANSSTSIGTEYLHDFLKAMTDYIKRNQLSGAFQIDRFLTRFGINLDSAKANRSIYVSSKSIDIDFGSVMQHTNTASAGDPSNLGDYAGQGLGRGEFSFDFKCDEFGIFIVTSSIVPASRLYQGFDRNNLHLAKTQFFTPEFDNLGCSAIPKGCVYVSNNGTYGVAPSYFSSNAIWGFAPRYYEYKQKTDYVTGDFVSPVAMQGGDAWHLNRIIDDSTFSNSIVNQHHSLNFTRGVDAGQYDRIFNYTDTDVDKFYIVYHFSAMASAPCKSLFDTYDFDDAGKALSMNGNSAKVN